MAQHKLERFQAINQYPNVFQAYNYTNPKLSNAGIENLQMRGVWNEQYFKNNKPITLELACGKAEYTLGMSAMYNDRNFIAIDIKGNRMYIGAKQALEKQRSNAAFLRTRIEMLNHHFSANEVNEIWIIFPDPQLQKARKRLTGIRFVDMYKTILSPKASINLKTDDDTLYQYTLDEIKTNNYELIYNCNDIYAEKELYKQELEIKTHYEQMHLKAGKKIKFISFRVN